MAGSRPTGRNSPRRHDKTDATEPVASARTEDAMANEIDLPPRRPIGLWLAGVVALAAVIALAALAWQQMGGAGSLSAEQQAAEAEARKKEEEQKQKELDPRVERLVLQPGDPLAEVQAL